MLPTQANEFREIVSGERRGVVASAWRGFFGLAEVPYRLAVGWRNRQYDKGHKVIHKVGVPVISVGNITMGGTGKTPTVEWLARWFRDRNIRVAIISRGYGAEDGARNDEALELEQKLPDVPHVQNPDRVAAAEMAIEEFETQLIILDDALQHRRIHRDLNLVLIDALEPFGYGHIFPRGTLREPLTGLARADLIGITRADCVDGSTLLDIRQRLQDYAPDAAVIEMSHAPRMLIDYHGHETPLSELAGKKVAAFCGIGNPDGFRHTLNECGFDVAWLREFADHHNYTLDDFESLDKTVQEGEPVDALLCTHKDLVKVGTTRLAGLPLYAVVVGLGMRHGEELLTARLESLFKRVEADAI